MPRYHSFTDSPLRVQFVAWLSSIDCAIESIITGWPKHHTTTVPYFVALLQKRIIEDIVHVGIHLWWSIFWNFVDHSHKHEDLIALATSVQEALSATEPRWNVLRIASATSATYYALRADCRNEHRVLDGAEWADERR